MELVRDICYVNSSIDHIYRGLMLMLDSSSTKAVSVKNYEIWISKSDFTHIHVYLCRVSFLKVMQGMQLDEKSLCMQIVTGDRICPSSSSSL